MTFKIGQTKNVCFTDKIVQQYWHFGGSFPSINAHEILLKTFYTALSWAASKSQTLKYLL